MVLKNICPPALIYLVFSLTQVGIDTVQGMYNIAFVKIWVTMIFTILLNFLCESGLGVISWLIVFLPFMLMTVIVTMLLFMFGLNPSTGRISTFNKKSETKLTRQERSAIGVAEDLASKMPPNNNFSKHNSKHNSKISPPERQVLTDMVQNRTKLQRDPLQKGY
jgi:hypothetical protein